jgi:pimeloyl-ACP methyl ester carboxylesterase
MRSCTRTLATITGFVLTILCAPGGVAESTFTVQLPCVEDLDTGPFYGRDFYGDEWYETSCAHDQIEIPTGRPVYALLVSGFHQNKNFDMFHWFDFAKYLQSKGAYVHYAWWNNLLAPYLERPLHDAGSVPSTGAFPLGTIVDARLGADKATPNDDFQFQADATALLHAIRANNPAAKIVLVGHSMGGVAVLRLAEQMPSTFVIDLLAPIDPVGNRSCIWDPWGTSWVTDPFGWRDDASCNGFFNFTRWRAIRRDQMDGEYFDPFLFYPPKRWLGANIPNLYHRWQQEFAPPYDYSCPGGADDVPWPCASFYDQSLWSQIIPGFFETDYLLNHWIPTATPEVPETYLGFMNVQSKMDTKLESGYDVPVALGNFGGGLDGHGELVGFRGAVLGTATGDFWEWVIDRLAAIGGVIDILSLTYDELSHFLNFESYPVGLAVEGSDWPSRDKEADLGNPDDPVRLRRVALLRAWETDSFHLYKKGYEPWNPGLCLVSRDLSNILDFMLPPAAGNGRPVADAGPGQTVSADDACVGQVVLDGTGSFDPNGQPLSHTWAWNGTIVASGPSPTLQLPPGIHEVTLVVSDGQAGSVPDIVTITVVDDTPPLIVLNGPSEVVLECAVDSWGEIGAAATDNCDSGVLVTVGGDSVDPAVPGDRVVTYDAVDASGNHATRMHRTIAVRDTLPPTLSAAAAHPSTLWPPDHSMVPVHCTVDAYDSCDATLNVMLVSVISSEPDDAPGGGDGHTTGDIRSCDIGTGDYDLLLRAERQGGKGGRTYTIAYSATDDAGNSTTSHTTVVVPHNAGGSNTSRPRR